MRYTIFFLLILAFVNSVRAQTWAVHTIDDSSRGADGVRVADVNQDGRMDLVTPWEQGGVVRVYLNPGPANLNGKWPAVTVGKVSSPEDAVFVDLDDDGAVDVVSSCEGTDKTVYVHWAPPDPGEYLNADAWQTKPIACTRKLQKWMFALPLQIDGKAGLDLIVGSKDKGGSVGWLQSPSNPRALKDWSFWPLYQAGWIMSLVPMDVDGDGDADVVVSDRKGKSRGVLWLENPGPKASLSGQIWNEHRIGATGKEVMFLTVEDLDRDGLMDVVTATRNGEIVFLRRTIDATVGWQPYSIPNPFGLQHGKAVRVADVDLDGRLDLIHTSNTGGNRKAPGVAWMSYRASVTDSIWDAHDISASVGVKFDLIQIFDLDEDGDLDVITCEERDNLGVFWYENPTR